MRQAFLPIASTVTMREHPPFESTLDAARRGDRQAADALYRAHQPMLLRYLRSQERRRPRTSPPRCGWPPPATCRTSRATSVASARGCSPWRERQGDRAPPQGDPSPDRLGRPGQLRREPTDEDNAVRAIDLVEAQRAVDMSPAPDRRPGRGADPARASPTSAPPRSASLMQRPEAWVRVTQHRAMKRLGAHVCGPSSRCNRDRTGRPRHPES